MRQVKIEKIPITIIGGGIVGCAIAYELSKYHEGIFLFEKELRLGTAQSERNSGVIHAGVYYNKDSLKAKLCVEGNKLLYDFCKEHDVPHANTGKLIVATNADEKKTLESYLKKANDNGVPGIRMISEKELRQMQPNVYGVSALYVPTTGLVDAVGYLKTLESLADGNGVEFLTESEIIDIRPKQDSFELQVRRRDSEVRFETNILINSAGLYSDEIARMVNPDINHVIMPVRGEYCKFNQRKKPELDINQMCVYPAPLTHTIDGRKARTLGVHLTPTFEMKEGEYGIGSVVLIGPTAISVDDREDYENNRQSAEYFHEKIKSYFPNIKIGQLSLDYSGIRAKLHDCEDFVIKKDDKHGNCIQLIGIDSPGLTSSLAIAKYVFGLFFK
ncbi:NAD(P)/FAD-dependent oxidoreductase [Candidatus Woesearchaeota archaeon]|nr:NAD(P)/FAD-dependent oxidoreductase [Candidatus Woesearchaeota archaeon]